MSGRSFSPMLSRRVAAKPAAKAAPAPRAGGAGAGMPRFIAAPRGGAAKASQTSAAATTPRVNRRGDRWETEANRAAETVARTPARTPASQRAPVTVRPVAAAAPFTGRPISPALRRRIEAALHADLGAVRLHTGPEAAAAAAQVGARAFTQHNHIFLGAGQSPDDLPLIAHEAAHTVQQSAAQNASASRGPPRRASSVTLSPAAPGLIQRDASDYVPGFVKDAGSTVVSGLKDAGNTVTSGVNAVGDLAAKGFWTLVDEMLPRRVSALLHEIREVGLLGFLKKKVSSALDAVFARLRSAGGTSAKVGAVFESLLAQSKVIWAALAAGCCEPLFAAVRSLGATLSKMAGEVWDEITDFLKPVGDWLENVWKKFGAPVVDFLKEYASEQWDNICQLGSLLWEATGKLRDFYAGAWESIKELLGFGQGGDSDGSGGVVAFIKEKAGAVWDELKEEAKPVLEPIRKVATAITSLLPLSAILNLREKINEWIEKATAMADKMDEPGGVADNQDLLRSTVLPGIRRAIGSLRDQAASASAWVAGKIGGLVGDVTGFFGSLSANTLLAPFRGALSWLDTEARALDGWATAQVAGVFALVDQALVALDVWLEPIFQMLKKLFDVLGNLMDRLGDLVLGPLLLVPSCIRDPIKDFIVTRILSQIPVFSQLLELPDVWAKVKPAFQQIIVLVFRDGNLALAAWTFFKTVLGLLGVPPELVTNLIRNAAKAIRDVLKDPVAFLGNVLSAMKQGLLQFIDRIGKHLFDGAVDWLLSGVKGAGVKIPDPFTLTLRNVLDLILQVLELTTEKIFQRIEKKKGPEVAKRARQVVGAGEKMFEWVTILINEGPVGLWSHIKNDLGNLWDTLLNMVIDFLIGKVVQQATLWVTKTLASGGLSVIFDAIKAVYDALQTLTQYLKQLLEVANSVCEGISDIAKGVIGKAADMVESAATRLIAPVLAFLAKTLGIGDLPKVIGEGIQKVRTIVEDAIDKLIDKTFAALDWAKKKGKEAVDAVLQWWKARKPFTNADGEEHTLLFQGTETSAHLTVESTPRPLVAFLASYESEKKPDAAEKEVIRQIRTKVTKIENLKSANNTRNRSNFTKSEGEEIAVIFIEIADLLGQLRGDGKPPATKVNWAQQDGEDGVEMVADPLSLNSGGLAGSQPREESKLWKAVNAKYPGEFVQGHLLNHHVHGPGEKKNLIPITRRANGRMERWGETFLKKAVLDENKVLHCVVRISGFHPKTKGFPEAPKLPRFIQIEAHEIAKKGKKGKGAAVETKIPPEGIESVLPG